MLLLHIADTRGKEGRVYQVHIHLANTQQMIELPLGLVQVILKMLFQTPQYTVSMMTRPLVVGWDSLIMTFHHYEQKTLYYVAHLHHLSLLYPLTLPLLLLQPLNSVKFYFRLVSPILNLPLLRLHLSEMRKGRRKRWSFVS